jgi:hypothetical protein
MEQRNVLNPATIHQLCKQPLALGPRRTVKRTVSQLQWQGSDARHHRADANDAPGGNFAPGKEMVHPDCPEKIIGKAQFVQHIVCNVLNYTTY